MQVRMSRVFAMPSGNTFSIKPIREFVERYVDPLKISIDPFARNSQLATWRNDLDTTTAAQYHMDAEEFLRALGSEHNVKAQCILFDPPYSPRQISECYKSVGLEVGMKGTQNAALYARVRDAIPAVCAPGAVVLSFGWNSCGMGKKHGAEILEIMLVAHGGAHNDTICVAERMP